MYDSDKLFVIVMELAPGGDLFYQVMKEYEEEAPIRHKLGDGQACVFACQMCLP